jgi:hypothetical protein
MVQCLAEDYPPLQTYIQSRSQTLLCWSFRYACITLVILNKMHFLLKIISLAMNMTEGFASGYFHAFSMSPNSPHAYARTDLTICLCGSGQNRRPAHLRIKGNTYAFYVASKARNGIKVNGVTVPSYANPRAAEQSSGVSCITEM